MACASYTVPFRSFFFLALPAGAALRALAFSWRTRPEAIFRGP